MQEENAISPPETPAKPSSLQAKPGRFTFFFSLILAFCALLLASFSLWHQMFFHQKPLQASEAKLNELSSISRINSTRISLLQQNDRQLQAQLSSLSQANSQNSQTLNQAAAWIRAAQTSQNLNNSNQALQYLQQADQTLSSLSSSQSQTIRASVIQGIERIKSTPTTDQSELIIKLDALNQSILSLATSFNPEKAPPAPTAKISVDNPYETTHWKDRLLNSLTYLKGFIVIRHDADLPILTPEQQTLIKMIVQFKIMQTQWAVMELQESIYQHNLSLITELVETYFIHSEDSAAIINQIKSLELIHLKNNKIDLSQSLLMIEAALKENNTATINVGANPGSLKLDSTSNKTTTPTPNTPTPPLHQSVEA